MLMLERGFHIVIRNVLFPFPTDVGFHNSLPWGSASSLAYRFPYHYKKCFVSLSNRCEISQSTPLAQRPCWHTGFHTLIRNVLFPSPTPISTLIRNVLFPSPTPISNRCGMSQFTPLGPVSLLAHRFPHLYKKCFVFVPLSNSHLQPIWDLTIHPPFQPIWDLTIHPPWDLASSLAHRFSYLYKKCFVPLSKCCGISQSIPLGPSVLGSIRCGIS